MKMAIPLATRQAVMTVFRVHYPGTPAEAGQALVAYARERGLTDRASALPGETLRHWATDDKAPLWAVTAAALWLDERSVQPTDPAEKAALTAVLTA